MSGFNYIYKEDVLEKMMELVSSRTGLIECGNTKNLFVDDKKVLGNIIPMFFSKAEIKIPEIENFRGDSKGVGSAASLSESRSMIKAIGECIERYCGYSFDEMEIYKSVNELNELRQKYVDPSSLVCFDDSQYCGSEFPFKKYTPDVKLYWVPAYNLSNNSTTLVPAQKVFLDYKRTKPDHILDHRLSTGLACGDSLYSAILSGIYECIERDAFYITWLFQLPGTIVNIDKIKDQNLANLYNLIKSNVLDDLYIIKLESDISVYSILTMLVNNNIGSVGLTVACASDLNPERAMYRSLEELILSNRYMYYILENKYNGEYPHFNKNDILDLESHLRYYLNPSSNSAINFLIDNNARINLSDLHDFSSEDSYKDTKFCINELKKIKIDAIYADITKPEINNIGLKVVKVLTPGLANLDISYNARHFGGARIKSYMDQNKYTINENPHPFP